MPDELSSSHSQATLIGKLSTFQLILKEKPMANSLFKNFAALTVAGTLLGFIVASTAVGVAVILNLTGVEVTSQNDTTLMQR